MLSPLEVSEPFWQREIRFLLSASMLAMVRPPFRYFWWGTAISTMLLLIFLVRFTIGFSIGIAFGGTYVVTAFLVWLRSTLLIKRKFSH